MINYTSSIISKYGDTASVKNDTRIMHEIFSRQGSQLFIDMIAEEVGSAANKFNFSASDRAMTIISLVDELENALKERL